MEQIEQGEKKDAGSESEWRECLEMQKVKVRTRRGSEHLPLFFSKNENIVEFVYRLYTQVKEKGLFRVKVCWSVPFCSEEGRLYNQIGRLAVMVPKFGSKTYSPKVFTGIVWRASMGLQLTRNE